MIRGFALVLVTLFLTSLVAFPSITQGEPTWDTQIVDTHGSYGKLAIDSNDNPHIVYNTYSMLEDGVTYGLSYAFWTGKNWSTQTIDSTGISGVLSLDDSNNPHILYGTQFPNDKLEYATLNGTNWVIQALPSVLTDRLNGYALISDPKGNPHVAYSNFSYANNTYTMNLMYAVTNGSNWAVQPIETKQSNTSSSYFPLSIILDSKGYPHILYAQKHDFSYYSNSLKHETTYPANDIKYAWWTGSKWIIQTVVLNESNAIIGAIGNLVLDSKEQPHFCYVHENLTYLPNYGSFLARYSLDYTYMDGSIWVNQNIQSKPDNIEYQQPFLRLDANNNPQVYFHMQDYQNTSDSGLKYATWTSSNWQIQTIGLSDYTSIAFDSQGNPHLTSYTSVGTIRGASILGNLTISSLEHPLFSNSILVTVIVVIISVAIAITVAIVSLLQHRRHQKTKLVV